MEEYKEDLLSWVYLLWIVLNCTHEPSFGRNPHYTAKSQVVFNKFEKIGYKMVGMQQNEGVYAWTLHKNDQEDYNKE